MNIVVALIAAVAIISGVLLVLRAHRGVLRRKSFVRVLFGKEITLLGPITPKRKNIYKSLGLALVLFGFALLLGFISCLGTCYSAWKAFTWLISGNYPDGYDPNPWIIFPMWLIEAAFLGFVVTLIVNIIGLGRKE